MDFFQKAFRLFSDRSEADDTIMLAQQNIVEPTIGQADIPEKNASIGATVSPTNGIAVKYQWVQNLTMANCQELEPLTFPSLQKRWQTYQQRGSLGGVVAIARGQMVGLVIAELLPDALAPEGHRAEILSLFVTPEQRQQGIGSQLLRYLETALRQLNCLQVQVSYSANDLTQQGLEPILHQQNWQAPKTDFLITKTTIEALKQASWVYQFPLPQKFTVFPWIELTKAERERIQQRQAYPDSLSPFTDDPRLEVINSLGLRYQGEVIGWTINHRVAPDTIRYSTLFVETPFQRMGRGFSLLTEAVKRQIESGIPIAASAVASDNLAMLNCADRYYRPYATYLSESRSSTKLLG
ncbi:MAG: GNAT family N-acetyltransferase [Alkalinema sp. RU_4_3]|nr:GNAT family N-acetyltransferase [Alkalinema sp. RU_4_3]